MTNRSESVEQRLARVSEEQHLLKQDLKGMRATGATQEELHPLRQKLMRNRLGPYGLRRLNNFLRVENQKVLEAARLQTKETKARYNEIYQKSIGL